MTDEKEMRQVLANTLAEIANTDKRIVVLEADLMGCHATKAFKEAHPDRFVNVGIAEANMIGIAAGMSAMGKIPFAYSFAPFATRRCYDTIFISVAYAKQHVKIVGSDPGIMAEANGGTHMPFEDMAIMRAIPGLRVLAPSTPNMTAKLTRLMAETDGPFYMRFGREINQEYYPENMEFTLGGSRLLRDGDRLTVMACGRMVDFAVRAADQLIKEGIRVRVVDMYSIKPIDGKAIEAAVSDTACILTVEDHNTIGGLGGAVSEYVTEHCPCKVLKMGMRDEFGRSGSSADLFEMYGLTADSIAARIRELLE